LKLQKTGFGMQQRDVGPGLTCTHPPDFSYFGLIFSRGRRSLKCGKSCLTGDRYGNASELAEGMVIRVEGRVYRVLKVESKAAAAKLGGVVKAELSNVVTGRLWEARFRPQEHVVE